MTRTLYVPVDSAGEMLCQNCHHRKAEHNGKRHTGACLRLLQTGYTNTGRKLYLRWREPTMAQLYAYLDTKKPRPA